MMIVGTTIAIAALISCYTTNALPEGAACPAARTGALGTCRLVNDCPKAIEDLKNGQLISYCGFKGPISIVCCPNPPVPPTTAKPMMSNRTSSRKCEEYSEAVYEKITIGNGINAPPLVRRESKCAIASVPFIVGGEPASPREFPHMALLGYQADPRTPIAYACGGSLISDRFVITAAHCVQPNRIIGDVKYVLLGEYVLDSTEDEATPILFNVTEIIKHDDFRHAVKYNDIALLRLNQTVTFTQYIRPACLYEFPTFPESAENKAQAIGWGRVNNEGKTSKTLLKVSLELYTANECTYAYHNVGTFSTLTKGIMHDQQFCAGDHNERKDTCKGDSGGPIQIFHPYKHCMYSLLGVTSFGKQCGEKDSPGVYTRIHGYIDWIEQNVWPNQ